MRIKEIVSLAGKGAISGETFRIISTENKAYKLRFCVSLLKARRIEKNVSRFSKAFPPFYGREGRFLLFDWIEGTAVTKLATPKVCYQIGKLLGEQHALNEIDSTKNPDTSIKRLVANLESTKIFNKEELAKLELKSRELREGLKLDLILEISDIHEGNVIIDKNGRVYFIDEEGVDHKIKGRGLAKPLLTKGWIKSPEQLEAFWRGYHEHHSSDYFDLRYQRLMAFLQLITTITVRVRTGADYSKELAVLMGMIT